MVKLYQEKSIEEKIIEDLDSTWEMQPSRGYLGYSAIGGKCPRALWYSFRFCKKSNIPGRILRLFSRGDQEELVIEQEFAKLGIEIKDAQKEVKGTYWHARGHCDGILYETPWFDEPVLLEIKTYNDRRFNQLRKLGVEQSDYAYYVQAQMYMGKLDLNKCLFIATNKNDDHRYVEIIAFNNSCYQAHLRKADSIILNDKPALQIEHASATWHECKMCKYIEICHYDKLPDKNCRTCEYGTIIDMGEWKCKLSAEILPLEKQLKGCEKYKILHTLVKEDS